ncbi:substrate-binding domain-containing protein [Sphingomonas flavalba]|uniref:substrate-binding domain-containing protein n=1 Tax=Sphingomonas flavalba TaxID=2559804 RepID=UPI00109DDFB2|nr:substrate-binding domain-containing protein [Sphingomonas flavalba]
MLRSLVILMASAGLLSACHDPAGGAGGGVREQIRAVGSSTVFPFTTAVAEQFVNAKPNYRSPIIESTGTGAGMKLFCSGVGAQYPDIENASRRMKAGEYALCKKNGVDKIVEIQIGVDGLALGESKRGSRMALSVREIYLAIAANPDGKPNRARTWADINPALPTTPIVVYGPPSTSGTRDSLTELIMTPGCDQNPANKALKAVDEDKHKDRCTRIREDGAYVDAGENDNLIVQKLGANPDAVGIFGYSFLEENLDTLAGIPIDGVEPTYDSIASFAYPGARPLYIYVKSAHLRAIPGLKEFVAEYAGAWNPGGPLARRGLIAATPDVRAQNVAVATALTPLDPAVLK